MRPAQTPTDVPTLRPFSRQLWIGERAVKLTANEVEFVNLLKRRGGRVVARETSCVRLWGNSGGSYEKRLDALIKRLRDKLGGDHRLIETVPGVGHRLRTGV